MIQWYDIYSLHPPTEQEHSVWALFNPEVLVPHGTQEEPSEKAASVDSPQEVQLNPAARKAVGQ